MESEIGKLIETQDKMVVAKGVGWGNEEMLVKGYKVSVIQDGYVLEI